MSSLEYDHAPGANLDYGFDWAARGWLEAGETIVTSTWTASTGITLTNAQNVAGVTSVYASGGVSGTAYLLTNTITTLTSGALSRTDSRTLTLACKRR